MIKRDDTVFEVIDCRALTLAVTIHFQRIHKKENYTKDEV